MAVTFYMIQRYDEIRILKRFLDFDLYATPELTVSIIGRKTDQEIFYVCLNANMRFIRKLIEKLPKTSNIFFFP